MIEKYGAPGAIRTPDLWFRSWLFNHRRTQNQRVTWAVVGNRWHCWAGLVLFCSTICSTLLVLLSLFASFALAQERRTFTVPFELHNGLILLKGELNGKPAALLLDTGANNSIVDAHSAGFNLQLDKLRSTGTAGAEGDCVVREVHLSLEHRSWLNRRVCVMDLSDASKRMGVHLDGFIGMDMLTEFRQVRINFETRTLELEK